MPKKIQSAKKMVKKNKSRTNSKFFRKRKKKEKSLRGGKCGKTKNPAPPLPLSEEEKNKFKTERRQFFQDYKSSIENFRNKPDQALLDYLKCFQKLNYNEDMDVIFKEVYNEKFPISDA